MTTITLASGAPVEIAEVLYEFVRDEVVTGYVLGRVKGMPSHSSKHRLNRKWEFTDRHRFRILIHDSGHRNLTSGNCF